MSINWTSALVQGAGLWDQLDRYDDLGSYVEQELGTLADNAIEGTQFTPFTVSGYGGSATAGPDGVTLNQSPEAQAQSQALQGQANQFFNSAAAPQGQRETDIYDRIRAMQMPGEERSMNSLESRAFAQGRLGMSSANHGGSSPEMLAMQTSIGENRNTAAFEAINMARQQQGQDATIGSQMQQNSYLPQAQLLNMLNPGLQTAQLNQAGQMGGQNLASQLGLGQVQAQVNSEQIRSQLMAGLFNTVGGAFGQGGELNNFDPLGDVAGAFGNWIGGIFGGP